MSQSSLSTSFVSRARMTVVSVAVSADGAPNRLTLLTCVGVSAVCRLCVGNSLISLNCVRVCQFSGARL
jgi:hypothetical protein